MPNIVDIFSGCGGLSQGFKMAGFNIAACVEIEPDHAQVYGKNFAEATVINKSVVDVSGDDLLNAAGSVDVFLGASPCQSFSKQGRQDKSDPRSQLIWESARLVGECSPDYFLMENVDQLVTNKKFEPLVKDLLEQMRLFGYNIAYRVFNTRDFGVPQSRSRVFFLGIKKGKPRPNFPKPLDIRVSIRDAIADLPEIEEFSELIDQETLDYAWLKAPSEYLWRLNHGKVPKTITGMQRIDHSSEVRERFAATPPGAIEPISRLKRLEWNGIAPTLKASYSKKSRHTAARPLHPATPRCISVREYARIQGYPDWFNFSPVKCVAYQQIGNSVSPVISEAFAREFLAVM